jgi:hypothetical protein
MINPYFEYFRGVFRRILKHRSTEEFESLPYICTLLNSSLWTYYGIIKTGEFLVATINGFGVVVEIVLLTLFLVFAPPRIRVLIFSNFVFVTKKCFRTERSLSHGFSILILYRSEL